MNISNYLVIHRHHHRNCCAVIDEIAALSFLNHYSSGKEPIPNCLPVIMHKLASHAVSLGAFVSVSYIG